MKKVDLLVIGFGKAGKTVAAKQAKAGKKVVLIEKDATRYGGTCINVACIPTKRLEFLSRQRRENDATWFSHAMELTNELVGKLRQKNENKLVQSGVELINGTARFVDEKVVEVNGETITADRILLNTGSTPNHYEIKGLENHPAILNNENLLSLRQLPKRLVVIGAGYIGLEMASIFANFGSKVTILAHNQDWMKQDDRVIATRILEDLKARGIEVKFDTVVQSGQEGQDGLILQTNQGALEADAVMVAIGRHPNTADLALDKTGVLLDDRGAVVVDRNLRSTHPDIYAAGDVRGGLSFTYTSLDDARTYLTGHKQEVPVPYSLFIDPTYAKIGQNPTEDTEVYRLEVANVPKAHVLGCPKGIFQVVVKDDQIVGAQLYGPEAHELIHIIQVAMMTQLPFSRLYDLMYAHPTMAESFNDLERV